MGQSAVTIPEFIKMPLWNGRKAAYSCYRREDGYHVDYWDETKEVIPEDVAIKTPVELINAKNLMKQFDEYSK